MIFALSSGELKSGVGSVTSHSLDESHSGDTEESKGANGPSPSSPDVAAELETRLELPLPDTPAETTFSVFSSRQKWTIILLVSVAAIFGPISSNIYVPALPEIVIDFKRSTQDINLTLTLYLCVSRLKRRCLDIDVPQGVPSYRTVDPIRSVRFAWQTANSYPMPCHIRSCVHWYRTHSPHDVLASHGHARYTGNRRFARHRHWLGNRG
jgi:hypothetical protein